VTTVSATTANDPASPSGPVSYPTRSIETAGTPGRRWPKVRGIAFGGDYNPEQWPESTWQDDVALMVEAGVSIVTLGVFSWALLEPAEGRYDFGWLDRIIDLLRDNGIAVDLATATASPPPWFSRRYPDSLPITREGHRLWPGSRQAYCPSSPHYRAASSRLAEALATRYGSHPALVMWHVNNEYGCHVPQCYCDVSAASFRRWLRHRYGELDRLNRAWGTAFWSQHYGDWEEILPPRLTPAQANPTQQLDWWRFSSDELLECFKAERDVLRRITPDTPITTNFMGAFKPVDYFSWAAEEDVVSNDHYLLGDDPAAHVHLAMSADLMRSLAQGSPWMLMEHSTSAVNWQQRNVAKTPGQLRRNSLQHVAHGADAVCFFQWRASRSGAEKFHSAMLPHAGTDTKVWREVVELGTDLRHLADVANTRVDADVAIVFDWESWWAVELDAHPSADVEYLPLIRDFYEALWHQGVTVDFVRPEQDLSRYKLVVVPSLYLVSDQGASNITEYVRGGGHLLCSFFSGIVDPDDAIRLGGYPGAFREVLGVRVEEFFPLRQWETVALSDGSTGSVWAEMLHTEEADIVSTYVDGPLAGWPAGTRHEFGAGLAHYVTTRLDSISVGRLVGEICAAAGVRGPMIARAGVEMVRRRGADGTTYLFVINHTDWEADLVAAGTELLTGELVTDHLHVAPGGVAVLREMRSSAGRE
jgi:beta-galactosidase